MIVIDADGGHHPNIKKNREKKMQMDNVLTAEERDELTASGTDKHKTYAEEACS